MYKILFLPSVLYIKKQDQGAMVRSKDKKKRQEFLFFRLKSDATLTLCPLASSRTSSVSYADSWQGER